MSNIPQFINCLGFIVATDTIETITPVRMVSDRIISSEDIAWAYDIHFKDPNSEKLTIGSRDEEEVMDNHNLIKSLLLTPDQLR